MKKPKSIHFVGVKGVGMAPLAIIAKEAGIEVTGSDIADEFITDWALQEAKITPFIGFSSEHVGRPDLVIVTGAHDGFDNVEVKEGKRKGIRVMAQGEGVGFFMEGKFGISVAGSHGKTTVTAMLATVLEKNRLSPSYLVGTGAINGSELPGHFGADRYFVTEADEYVNEPTYDKTPKFLYQHPQVIIMTNIEFDHPDVFSTLTDVREAFLQFARQLPSDGLLVANGDDRQIQKILPQVPCRVVTYGMSGDNDFRLSDVSQSGSKTYFRVEHRKVRLGEFTISVPGVHNAVNALTCLTVSLELGLTVSAVKKTLPSFRGTKRRLEFLGERRGITFFDDYAHHPTEIKATLKTLRTIFPKKKILCIFQPHTYSRTKKLFDQFIHSFYDADIVVIINIYPSLREEPDTTVSSKALVEGMSRFHPNVLFLPEAQNVIEYVEQKYDKRSYVVITMGAGDVYKIAASLL